ncbi:MAG: hypothetical protein IT460_04070 [Planctomycetes bacterium]|nr:hypothetical protein [Planctomycetota bacterium]
MRERDFEIWLERWYRTGAGNALDPATRGSRLSSVKRIDNAMGNLDVQWGKDRGRAVLDRLHFTRADARIGRKPSHGIRIDGDNYTGTATLRTGAVLYFAFCEAWPTSAPAPGGAPPLHPADKSTAAPSRRGRGSATWPLWDQPSDADMLGLARVLARFARFINPALVSAVVEDNVLQGGEWAAGMRAAGVEPAPYLWDRSPCAFPGVRRYAGSREIAEFHGHRDVDGRPAGALALDDNSHPKHIWSFALRGRPFQQFGPEAYALAHLADHKVSGSRVNTEIPNACVTGSALFGLFTSPANAVYVPTALLRPTDHAPALRNLLLRRAQSLYGSTTNLFPPPYEIPEGPSDDWRVDRFRWAAPVGTTEFLADFLAYRRDRIGTLLAGGGCRSRSTNRNKEGDETGGTE